MLAGFAVPVAASFEALAAGRRALETGNSGLARARVTEASLDPSLTRALVENAERLGESVVVRSSAPLEADGRWAGAFASYAELAPDEAISGLLGCWASVFAPDPLERARAVGLNPAELGMAVLVQPEISPDFGGVATVSESETVSVVAIAGPPAAIVSGWERGEVVVVDQEGPHPAVAAQSIGRRRVKAVADLARATTSLLGLRHIEWAEADGHLWLLQAQARPQRAFQPPLPTELRRHSYDSSQPGASAAELLHRVREEVEGRETAGRFGMTQSEPALFEAVTSTGTRWEGSPAAAGWGAGRIHLVRDAGDAEHVEPRQILAVLYPLNNLAPLLWDAAGLVTIGGSPGAHLFEVAASLGLPAVCGVDLADATGPSLDALRASHSWVGAVDGTGGSVTILDIST